MLLFSSHPIRVNPLADTLAGASAARAQASVVSLAGPRPSPWPQGGSTGRRAQAGRRVIRGYLIFRILPTDF